MHDFFVPPHAPFIEPISSATFLRGHGAEEDSGMKKQKIRVANIFGTMDDKTQFEVRCVSEVVINDIFKSLLDSEDVGEYLQDVFNEADSRSVAVSKAKGAGGATITVDGTLSIDTNLVGNPVYGVYFDEVGVKGGAEAGARTKATTASVDTKEDDQFDEEIPFPSEMTEADKEKQEQAAAALRDGTFIDLASEILRNTMYNLMQEAACDEFSVDAEPLAFMVKE